MKSIPCIFSVVKTKASKNLPTSSIYFRVGIENDSLVIVSNKKLRDQIKEFDKNLGKLIFQTPLAVKNFVNGQFDVMNYLTYDAHTDTLIPISDEEFELFNQL